MISVLLSQDNIKNHNSIQSSYDSAVAEILNTNTTDLFHIHGYYTRIVILPDLNEPITISITRIKMINGPTHSLIPSFAIPHSKYSVMEVARLLSLKDRLNSLRAFKRKFKEYISLILEFSKQPNQLLELFPIILEELKITSHIAKHIPSPHS